MFDNLLGASNDAQNEIQERLNSKEINISLDGVQIHANGAGVVMDIELDASLMSDQEKLQDLLVLAVNQMQEQVNELTQEVTQEMMENLFKGDLGNLFG